MSKIIFNTATRFAGVSAFALALLLSPSAFADHGGVFSTSTENEVGGSGGARVFAAAETVLTDATAANSRFLANDEMAPAARVLPTLERSAAR
jgi:hypothetical protein